MLRGAAAGGLEQLLAKLPPDDAVELTRTVVVYVNYDMLYIYIYIEREM